MHNDESFNGSALPGEESQHDRDGDKYRNIGALYHGGEHDQEHGKG